MTSWRLEVFIAVVTCPGWLIVLGLIFGRLHRRFVP